MFTKQFGSYPYLIIMIEFCSKKGSIWRKWDLHIHTPASFHWNGGKRFVDMSKEEEEAFFQDFVAKVNELDIYGFGIMDYWTFDGYIKLRKFLSHNPDVQLKKKVFPGMELRIEAPVDYRLNIHVLFSDEVTDQKLKDFKSMLKIKIGTSERSLSDEALIEFAESLPTDIGQKHGFKGAYKSNANSLLQLGNKTVKITRHSFEEAVKQFPVDKCLIIAPYDTSDGLKDLKWEKHPSDDFYFMQLAHFFETRSSENVDLFLGKTTPQNREFIGNFIATMGGYPKPVLSGSDAHRLIEYGQYPSGRATWLKADVSFDGLRQVMLEPQKRCFVGKMPDQLVRKRDNETKYIKSIQIKKNNQNFPEEWFDAIIELNGELTAIIGNKGSGKSALADIIALLGNTAIDSEAFSFLNSKKFRQKLFNRSQHYKAIITWENSFTEEKILNQEIVISDLERVKYIPQNFFEKICTDLPGQEPGGFDNELQQVIFSHVQEAERLGCRSLLELINHKTKETYESIALIRRQLHSVNAKLYDVQKKLYKDHKSFLENKLKIKKEEFESLENQKPVPIIPPSERSQEQDELILKIDELKTKTEVLQKNIEDLSTKKNELTKLNSNAKNLLKRLENLESKYREFITQSQNDFQSLNLTFNEILKFEISDSLIIKKIDEHQKSINTINQQLSKDNDESLISQFSKTQIEIKKLQNTLHKPEQEYQEYLNKKAEWEKKKNLILGSEDEPETIRGLEYQINRLPTLNAEFIKLKVERGGLTGRIFAKYQELVDEYKKLYKPVQDFIKSHPIAKQIGLHFDVSIVSTRFNEDFYNWIDRGRTGSFKDTSIMSDLLERTDFNDCTSVTQFLNDVVDLLESDKREKSKSASIQLQIEKQLKPSRSDEVVAFYDFIFSLEYLKPQYTLKLDGRTLNQLSPGQKGALLLIFYLLVDRDDIPIIIDQPEENLDNQTIYKYLVGAIAEAKKRRQIIIVTHNPNLAVVCDAEQIIFAKMYPEEKNRIEYRSGAIENPEIKPFLLDILEGTRPAFYNRQQKYSL